MSARCERREPRSRDDRGETLLELVVSMAVIGVAVVAVVGGLSTSIFMSDLHRKQATAGAAVRDYAEAVQSTVISAGYTPCAAATRYAATTVGFAAPTGYQPVVVSVRYWSSGGWQTTCSSDSGLQQVTIGVSNGTKVDERLTVVVRRPCRVEDPLCA